MQLADIAMSALILFDKSNVDIDSDPKLDNLATRLLMKLIFGKHYCKVRSTS